MLSIRQGSCGAQEPLVSAVFSPRLDPATRPTSAPWRQHQGGSDVPPLEKTVFSDQPIGKRYRSTAVRFLPCSGNFPGLRTVILLPSLPFSRRADPRNRRYCFRRRADRKGRLAGRSDTLGPIGAPSRDDLRSRCPVADSLPFAFGGPRTGPSHKSSSSDTEGQRTRLPPSLFRSASETRPRSTTPAILTQAASYSNRQSSEM